MIVRRPANSRQLSIELSNPATGNALSSEVVEMLIAELELAHKDPPERIVVTGAGRHFCTGFDFSDIDDLRDGDLLQRFVRVETALQLLRHAPCTTIAYAQGAAYGAGADLFVACEHRFASSSARFLFPGARFGLVLGTGRLSQLVGADVAVSLIEQASPVGADSAVQAGLLSDVVDDHQFLEILAKLKTPLDVETRRMLRSRAKVDSRDADMAALVRSASVPGVKARICAYRASIGKD